MIYTGLRYIKMPYGPVVDNYNVIIDSVAKNNNLQVKMCSGFDAGVSQYIEPVGDIINNITTVSDFEKNIIYKVINKFINLTASSLSDFSHKLAIWKASGMYDFLDFKYADYDKYKINEDNIGTFYQLVMS
jgi:hypothetical protein